MTERDAFGNPIIDSQPAPQPVVEEDPRPQAPELQAPAPPRRSGRGPLLGLVVLLLFLAPLAVGGLVAYNAFHTAKSAISTVDGIHDFVRTSSGDAGSRSPSTREAGAPPTGVTGASMLAAGNLRRGLRAARRDPGGRLGLLRAAPERLDLQLTRRGGGLDLLQLRHDGGRSLIHAPGSGGARKAIVFSSVDVQAPRRLVRQAAHRLGRSTKAIDYVVLIDVLDGPGWSAYFQGGAAFQGDAHGRIVRRIQ